MYHEIEIVGRLGADPEMSYVGTNGNACTRMRVAVDDSYKDANGVNIERTIWFNVTAWGRRAENCNQYLHKGSPVLVKGNLRGDAQTGGPRLFTRQDGTVGSSYDIVASLVKFLPDPSRTNGNANGAAQTDEIPEDAIPFATTEG